LQKPKTPLQTPKKPRQPPELDHLIFHRFHQLWDVLRPLGKREVTIAWCARLLVQLDGGPPPDAGQLAPALRALGFRPVRRRLGARRIMTWLTPGGVPARVGRPSKTDGRDGDPSMWLRPLRRAKVLPFRPHGR
jgi:hypothetical protein